MSLSRWSVAKNANLKELAETLNWGCTWWGTVTLVNWIKMTATLDDISTTLLRFTYLKMGTGNERHLSEWGEEMSQRPSVSLSVCLSPTNFTSMRPEVSPSPPTRLQATTAPVTKAYPNISSDLTTCTTYKSYDTSIKWGKILGNGSSSINIIIIISRRVDHTPKGSGRKEGVGGDKKGGDDIPATEKHTPRQPVLMPYAAEGLWGTVLRGAEWWNATASVGGERFQPMGVTYTHYVYNK